MSDDDDDSVADVAAQRWQSFDGFGWLFQLLPSDTFVQLTTEQKVKDIRRALAAGQEFGDGVQASSLCFNDLKSLAKAYQVDSDVFVVEYVDNIPNLKPIGTWEYGKKKWSRLKKPGRAFLCFKATALLKMASSPMFYITPTAWDVNMLGRIVLERPAGVADGGGGGGVDISQDLLHPDDQLMPPALPAIPQAANDDMDVASASTREVDDLINALDSFGTEKMGHEGGEAIAGVKTSEISYPSPRPAPNAKSKNPAFVYHCGDDDHKTYLNKKEFIAHCIKKSERTAEFFDSVEAEAYIRSHRIPFRADAAVVRCLQNSEAVYQLGFSRDPVPATGKSSGEVGYREKFPKVNVGLFYKRPRTDPGPDDPIASLEEASFVLDPSDKLGAWITLLVQPKEYHCSLTYLNQDLEKVCVTAEADIKDLERQISQLNIAAEERSALIKKRENYLAQHKDAIQRASHWLNVANSACKHFLGPNSIGSLLRATCRDKHVRTFLPALMLGSNFTDQNILGSYAIRNFLDEAKISGDDVVVLGYKMLLSSRDIPALREFISPGDYSVLPSSRAYKDSKLALEERTRRVIGWTSHTIAGRPGHVVNPLLAVPVVAKYFENVRVALGMKPYQPSRSPIWKESGDAYQLSTGGTMTSFLITPIAGVDGNGTVASGQLLMAAVAKGEGLDMLQDAHIRQYYARLGQLIQQASQNPQFPGQRAILLRIKDLKSIWTEEIFTDLIASIKRDHPNLKPDLYSSDHRERLLAFADGQPAAKSGYHGVVCVRHILNRVALSADSPDSRPPDQMCETPQGSSSQVQDNIADQVHFKLRTVVRLVLQTARAIAPSQPDVMNLVNKWLRDDCDISSFKLEPSEYKAGRLKKWGSVSGPQITAMFAKVNELFEALGIGQNASVSAVCKWIKAAADGTDEERSLAETLNLVWSLQYLLIRAYSDAGPPPTPEQIANIATLAKIWRYFHVCAFSDRAFGPYDHLGTEDLPEDMARLALLCLTLLEVSQEMIENSHIRNKDIADSISMSGNADDMGRNQMGSQWIPIVEIALADPNTPEGRAKILKYFSLPFMPQPYTGRKVHHNNALHERIQEVVDKYARYATLNIRPMEYFKTQVLENAHSHKVDDMQARSNELEGPSAPVPPRAPSKVAAPLPNQPKQAGRMQNRASQREEAEN